jgi:hypothetical protein
VFGLITRLVFYQGWFMYFKKFIAATVFMPVIGGGFSHAYIIVHQYFDLQIKIH